MFTRQGHSMTLGIAPACDRSRTAENAVVQDRVQPPVGASSCSMRTQQDARYCTGSRVESRAMQRDNQDCVDLGQEHKHFCPSSMAVAEMSAVAEMGMEDVMGVEEAVV